MESQKELHFQRLRESLEQIPSLRGLTAFSSEFKNWKSRTQQSIETIFGSEHPYSKMFHALVFLEDRVSYGPSESLWELIDKETFEKDLDQAQRIIENALEEVGIIPEITPPVEIQKPPEIPSVISQLTNVLPQTRGVDIPQVIMGLEDLGLKPEQKTEAEKLAKELYAEIKGQKRWPILAYIIEKIKAIGKPVYERVALPLLLDMIKKELGIRQ